MFKSILTTGRVLLVISCCSLFLLSACATTAQKQDSLEKRAMARWNAVLAGDYLAAYDFLSPGFRSSVSFQQYQRARILQQVQWTGARYIESDCTENACKIKISLDLTLYGALPGVKSFDATQDVDESWVRVDGNWYFVPES